MHSSITDVHLLVSISDTDPQKREQEWDTWKQWDLE